MLKMKPLLPMILASLMAVGALALPTPPAAASTIPDYPFVHVVGNSFRIEMPDIAALDFQIVAADTDPAAARAVIEARVAEIRALMQELSIDPEDMVVNDVRQGVRKEPGPNGAAMYELSAAVKIQVRNVANWPRLAGGVLGKPNVDSFAADFDLSTMEKVNDELVAAAIVDARRRAEVMAAASGRRLGPAMAMTTDALKKLGTRLGLEREEFKTPRAARRTGNQRADEIDRETFLAVQALKLGQSVDIVYRLENGPAAKAAPARRP